MVGPKRGVEAIPFLKAITLQKSDMTMGNQPFEDVSPIKNLVVTFQQLSFVRFLGVFNLMVNLGVFFQGCSGLWIFFMDSPHIMREKLVFLGWGGNRGIRSTVRNCQSVLSVIHGFRKLLGIGIESEAILYQLFHMC